jgi:hypothetical protein
MKKVPSRCWSRSSAAACSARRVLPIPPGPVSVSNRTSARLSKAQICASSRSRPISELGWTGRLLGRASSVLGGGKSAGKPSIRSWNRRTGEVRSFSRCSPRSRSSVSRTSRSRVVCEMRTCPPCPAAITRAARWTSRPQYPLSSKIGSPVWIPMRTLSGPPASAAGCRQRQRRHRSPARTRRRTNRPACPLPLRRGL